MFCKRQEIVVLGLETSCDETAAAIVSSSHSILANLVLSQEGEHRPFGGVVPEVAARSHLQHIDHIVAAALREADLSFTDINGVAVTGGPGLIGGVLIGVMTAKAISIVCGIPFLAVNHLEGHALTIRLIQFIPFPYLLLLVSGGHCQLLVVEKVGCYRLLGTTLDDAVGEAFDKVAKMLGLGYPGGHALEQIADLGNNNRFSLPRPMRGRPGCSFSFSGLKTAVRETLSQLKVVTPQTLADLAASFQLAAVDVIADRTDRAIDIFLSTYCPSGHFLVAAGGVASNRSLRKRLTTLAESKGLTFAVPPTQLCTDNAAMIAWAGIERMSLGYQSDLTFKANPRWQLIQEQIE